VPAGTEAPSRPELDAGHDRRPAMTHTNHLDPRRHLATAALGMLAVLALGGCGRPLATSAPSTSPGPSVAPSVSPSPTTISSAEQAVAIVLAADPRFAGLESRNLDLIGQCCFYMVAPAADGFAVRIEIGWGDCPAGCINRHHWTFAVARDGTVTLQGEDGPPVPAGVPGPGGGTGGGVVGISGVAAAGPVCPVVRPNDPACADRPVGGATVHVFDATGLEVATLETDALGAFVVTLPPGRYRVQADPVEGLMGTPGPVDVTVGSTLEEVQLAYDTGIR
jgi:hypothetical protein